MLHNHDAYCENQRTVSGVVIDHDIFSVVVVTSIMIMTVAAQYYLFAYVVNGKRGSKRGLKRALKRALKRCLKRVCPCGDELCDINLLFTYIFLQQLTEIMFQFVCLLYYNGLNVFDTNEIILAQSKDDVLRFSLIFSLNCGALSILWRLPGVWIVEMFIVGLIFDICYAWWSFSALISLESYSSRLYVKFTLVDLQLMFFAIIVLFFCELSIK